MTVYLLGDEHTNAVEKNRSFSNLVHYNYSAATIRRKTVCRVDNLALGQISVLTD